MDRLFRIDFYPQDWLIDTARMDNDARGIYIQVVMLIYANRGPIELDFSWIGRAANVSKTVAKNTIERLIFSGFLQEIEGKLTQKRAENEIKVKQNHIQNSSKGGKKSGGGNRKINNIEASDPPEPLPSPHPSPNPSPISTPRGVDTPVPPTSLFPNQNPEVKNARPKRSRVRQSSTFIAEDFGPDIAALDLARELEIDVDRAAREFIDYWKGRGESRADWQATFRNRLRDIAKYRAERQQRDSVGRSNVRDVTGAALRVIAVRSQA